MKAVLFKDIDRTKLYSESYNYCKITFNEGRKKCQINDHRMKNCNMVRRKTMGRTEVQTYQTKIWGEDVYFRITELIKH